MEQLRLKISGMSCGHCVGAVTKALKSVDGVNIDDVKVGSATVSFDPAVTSPTRIAGAVKDAGYETQAAEQVGSWSNDERN